jgi:peptidoglycan hydrolase-like protein with peptidoglycan-binding domain
MNKLTTIALAAALGIAWSVLPAGAEDTLKDKADSTGDKIENKAERAKDKIEDKSERAKDKIENKSERAKDKVENKADAKGDTVGDKVDRAVDKTKSKAHEVKEKISHKLDRGDTKNAQQALQAKGYNPGPIDGVYGPRTAAAIRDYQKAEGLTVTGQMDGDTRARLMASTGTTTSPAASPATGTQPAVSSPGSPTAPAAPPAKVETK